MDEIIRILKIAETGDGGNVVLVKICHIFRESNNGVDEVLEWVYHGRCEGLGWWCFCCVAGFSSSLLGVAAKSVHRSMILREFSEFREVEKSWEDGEDAVVVVCGGGDQPKLVSLYQELLL